MTMMLISSSSLLVSSLQQSIVEARRPAMTRVIGKTYSHTITRRVLLDSQKKKMIRYDSLESLFVLQVRVGPFCLYTKTQEAGSQMREKDTKREKSGVCNVTK
jgi:hypothetical protein